MTDTETTTEPKGLAKLRAHKEAAKEKGDLSFTLPESGVVVTMPRFRSNRDWMKAQALSGGDQRRGNMIWATLICRFDGERISMADYEELISAADNIEVINKLFEADAKN